MEKTCKICLVSKPLDSFAKDSQNKDKHKNSCKSCRSSEHRIYYSKNAPKIIQSTRRWQLENLISAKEQKYNAYLKKKSLVALIQSQPENFSSSINELRRTEDTPKNPEKIIILSLGAGVQSTTIALMAEKGELPKPKAAIFADTQSEPESVYKHLNWLEKQLSYPIYRVTAGSLEEESLEIKTSQKTGKKYINCGIPAFVDNGKGGKGILGRRCTAEFKIKIIIRKLRELCDYRQGEKRTLITQWIGISYDELIRMKPSQEPWVEHDWPLIDLKMTRANCLEWMKKNGYPEPPRSACVFCPFHSDKEWVRLKFKEPAAFQRAVNFERKLQISAKNQEALDTLPFLHSSLKPLDQVEFKDEPSHSQVSQFGNDCSGMCGV